MKCKVIELTKTDWHGQELTRGELLENMINAWLDENPNVIVKVISQIAENNWCYYTTIIYSLE